jgi:RNA polymerase sigma-70 factor (ECF subfamily)
MTAAARKLTEGDVAELVTRAGDGDRLAEQTLCTRMFPAVFVFARRRLGSTAMAEDFTQDMMLLLVEALRGRKIEEPGRLGAWVLGVCRNQARQRATRAERRRDLWERYAPREDASVDAATLALLRPGHLEDCLSQLTERSRQVLRSSFFEGEGGAQIGEALGMTEGNVRVVRHRALAQLRGCLNEPLSWSQV